MASEALSPGPTDEQLKVTDSERSREARFISPNGLSPDQEVFQAKLTSDFFYPEQNQPLPIAEGENRVIYPLRHWDKSHDEWMRSGQIVGMTTALMEEKRIGGVMDYAIWRLGDPRRMIVNISPPPEGKQPDKSWEIAEEAGAIVVDQREVLDCLDPEKAERLLSIPYPYPEGKGAGLLSASIVRFLAEPNGMPKPDESSIIAVIDTDLINPGQFDVWGYLAEAAYQDGANKLQYRAARGGRGNEPVKAGIELLELYAIMDSLGYHGDTQKIIHFHRDLSRDQWPLSGQHFTHTLAAWHRMHPTSHSIETGTNWHLADLSRDPVRNPQKMGRAQVVVPTMCNDPGNNESKEQGMMYLANAFAHTLALSIYRSGKWIGDFTVDDYKRLNMLLQEKKAYSYIPMRPGPNQLVSARMDYVWPPLPMLQDEGIIIPDKVNKLKAQFSGRWPAVEIPRKNTASENGTS